MAVTENYRVLQAAHAMRRTRTEQKQQRKNSASVCHVCQAEHDITENIGQNHINFAVLCLLQVCVVVFHEQELQVFRFQRISQN